jgi:ABC-type polysaccharide/polyol phosphate export permease
MPAPPTIRGTLQELWQYRVFLKYKCLSKLKLRHTGTVLGYVWWLLDPLLFLGIFYLVFEVILKRGGDNFVLFLFCALLPWRWFTTSVSEATVSVRSAGGLLKQVYYPKVIEPLTSVFTNTVHFLFGLVILAAIMLAMGVRPGWNLLYFPIIAFAQLCFTTGLGMLLAHAMVYFQDTKELLRYVLQMWFYLSPSVYPLERIPQSLRHYMLLNPFAILFQDYRAVIMQDQSPHILPLLTLTAVGLLLTVLGLRVFARGQGHYAKVL